MKFSYVDTSVLVAILFRESKFAKLSRLLLEYDEIFSSHLAEAELASAASREKVDLALARKIMANISLIMPDRSLFEEYREIFAGGYCRGADAYHLACALYLKEQEDIFEFITLDLQQARVARACGFQVVEF